MTLVTLVPRLPPAIDGVGDYAFKLASQLREEFGVTTRFIVADPTWHRNDETASWSIAALPERSASALVAALADATTVMLHYVPHGYAPKACPRWLVEGLEYWHAKTPNARLTTMFHELYALDWHRPWSSDFYLSPVQQRLAVRVARLSDAALTSTAPYRLRLRQLSGGKHRNVPVLPVFSNVGEVSHEQRLSDRQPRLVIFGQRHSKRLIYEQSGPLLRLVCQTLGIAEIWDIGPTTGIAPSNLGGVPITELGLLSEAEIGDRLTQAMAGFLNYDPRRLGKSGIFAAYCAYGLLPINQRRIVHPVDGLVAGLNYWVPTVATEHQELSAIAQQAQTWYQSHSLAAQAKAFIQCLSSDSDVLAGATTHDQ
jgi:hypothetical protein